MKPICFYHKADLDGVCSAAIVKHFVPDCELYGIDYGDEFPWDFVRPGPDAEASELWAHLFVPENGYRQGVNWESLRYERRTVYVVDFSLEPFADMERLAKVSELVWIDHHKTAIDAYNEALGFDCPHEIMLQTKWAACELCWYYFTGADLDDPAKEIPEAVRLLGTYDSWRKDDPEWDSKIMPFQYGCRSAPGIYDPTAVAWPVLLSFMPPDKAGYTWYNFSADEQAKLDPAAVIRNDIGRLTADGKVILEFAGQQNAKIAEAGAFELFITTSQWLPEYTDEAKYRCIVLNTPVFNSQAFDSIYDAKKHDVMVPFAMMANGKWKLSLYSEKPEIDCSLVAKAFGGGGHKGAAGFTCDKLPWRTS